MIHTIELKNMKSISNQLKKPNIQNRVLKSNKKRRMKFVKLNIELPRQLKIKEKIKKLKIKIN